jgi:hypothetical protein
MSKPKHYGNFKIVDREPTVWMASCGRHFTATGATYAEAEDKWRQHVHAETGTAPEAWGDKSVPRWTPEAVRS